MPKKRKELFEFRPFESVNKHDKHLRITNSMMESKAWVSLSTHSMILYIYMKKKYNFNNADDISFTYKEGKELMSKAVFTKSLDQLIECGLIDVVEQNWSSRKCNIYGFSARWHKYGTSDFVEHSRIKRKARSDVTHNKGHKQPTKDVIRESNVIYLGQK